MPAEALAEEVVDDDLAPTDQLPSDPDMSDGNVDDAFTSAMRDSVAKGDAPADEPATPATPATTEAPADSSQAVTDPVAVEEPAAAPVVDQTLVELRSAAQELGVTVGPDATGNDLALAALRKLHADRPMVTLAQQTLAQQYAQQPPSQVQPGSPATAQAQADRTEWTPKDYFKEAYGGPEWQSAFDAAISSRMVVRDEATNLWKPAPGYEVMAGAVIGPMNEAEQHQQKFWQDISRSNPIEKFYDQLMPAMQRAWKADMEQHLRQREQVTQQQSTVQSFESQNADWLFRTDPVSGQQVLTDKGATLTQTINELRESGVTDSEKLLALSLKITGFGKEAAQPAAAQPAPVSPQGAAPVTGVPQPAAGEPAQSPKPSFLESALRKASHSPNANGHSGDAGVPQAMTDGDLDNLFLKSYQSSK